MSKKRQFSSFSKRLTRRIMLALTLALIVVAASFNWIAAEVFTRYYKAYCKILLDVKNETVRKALYGVEVAVMNSTDDLEEQLQSPATVFNALSDELLPALLHLLPRPVSRLFHLSHHHPALHTPAANADRECRRSGQG